MEQINLDIQGFDRFSYTKNNPIKFTDPTGHCADPVSGTLCLSLIPTGPIGWIIIGGLVIVDTLLIVNLVDTWDTPATTVTTETTTLDLVVTAKKNDLQQVDDVADKFRMTEQERKAFGRFLEDLKRSGEGGTANERGDFTWKELEEKAREFLDDYRK